MDEGTVILFFRKAVVPDPYLRRAASRFGMQLSAAIYDKALRITDQSGVVASASASEAKGASESMRKATEGGKKESDGKLKDEDEETGGTDVGKIVNLMGIDWWGFH